MLKPLLASLTATLISAPVLAQANNCAPRDVVVDRLSLTYGEVFNGGGLQSDEAVFEVWISEEAGTWTILMTQADGTSCIMAAGTDWQKALASQVAKGVPS